MKGHSAKKIDRVIVLGHSGFIGGRLIKYLSQNNPEIEIIGYSREEIDLTKPQSMDLLTPLFTDNAVVVMLSGIKPNIQENISSCLENISMVANVSSLIARRPVGQFIYMSSAAVYGEDVNNTAISEETNVNPRSYYGIAKYASERLLQKTFENTTGTLLILRPPTIYGPGELGYSYNPGGFLTKAIRGEKLVLWGDGSERREFIYVDDIVKIMYQLIFLPTSGILNIASGTSYTFQDAIKCASVLAHKKIALIEKQRTKEKVNQGFLPAKFNAVIPNFKFTPLDVGMKLIQAQLKKN